MNNHSPLPITTQPSLFPFDKSVNQLELFPSVWRAAEELTSPYREVRQRALEHLLSLNAPRFSPLIAYLLFTRITDSDLGVRSGVIRALGAIFRPDQEGRWAPEEVINHLSYHLFQMRMRQIFALLEAISVNTTIVESVKSLINRCPYAGNHLVDILMDRKMPYSVREQAARIIGQVGFLDAIPTLEKLVVRLETRLQSQGRMPFAPPQPSEESLLLPAIQEALDLLRSP